MTKQFETGINSIRLFILSCGLISGILATEVYLFMNKTSNLLADVAIWLIFVAYYFTRMKKHRNMKKEILDIPLLFPIFILANQELILITRFTFIICIFFDYFVDLIDEWILDHQVALIFVSIFILQVLGGIGLMVFEDLSFRNAEWLTFISATTVGYGDISATTLGGQLVTVFITISGGLVYSSLLITSVIEFVAKKKENRFKKLQQNNSETENVTLINLAFERFSNGQITLKELKEITIKELAKKDEE